MMVLEPASVCSHFQRGTTWPIKAKFHIKQRQILYKASIGRVASIGKGGGGGNFNETRHEALMTQVLQCIYKS